MLKTDQLWEKMRAQAEAEGASEILAYMQNVELKLKSDIAAQQARFDSYLPKRPADEPHDARCQITRWGPNQCCTCESNIVMENYFLLQINGDLVHQPADLREQPCLNAEVVYWCLTNCKGKWDYRFNWYVDMLFVMEFENELDRLHFKLRWLG